MRYLSMIKLDERTAKPPTEKLMEDMGKLMEESRAAGTLIRTAGLRPSREGFRVRLQNGKLSRTDGPFTEAKEVVGGYAIIEAGSKAEAIEQVEKFLLVHGDEWNIECEVRPLDGPEFGADG